MTVERRQMKKVQQLSLGIDLGGTSTRAGLFDAQMQLLGSRTMATQVAAGPRANVQQMAAAVRALLQEHGPREAQVQGIGIGSPGPLNLRTGVLGLRESLETDRTFIRPAALGSAAGLLGAALMPGLDALEQNVRQSALDRGACPMTRLKTILTMAASLLLTAAAQAEIRLPNLLSDHAVLQRGGPIHLWGWATPGATLSFRFNHQTVTGSADRLGYWSVYLAPELAGGPYTLAISGDGAEKKLTDLLVGDVWLASGQSNMEMPLAGFPPGAFVKDADKEIAAATNPRLRLVVVDHKASDFPLRDVSGHWTECTPATAKSFSAVAYFFGREIAAREKVPIGLVDSTWGGTPADSWVSLDMLGSDAALLPAFASRAKFANRQSDLDSQIAAEKAEDEEAKRTGKPRPQHDWHPYETSWLPAGLYNGMIAPITPMSIKGFLWYQGETNSAHDRAPYYSTLFSALITDWRNHFAQGTLPFLFVQISSYQSPGEDWATVRDQQRRTLSLANTAMAVSLDVGQADNVHPARKQEVGSRLALAARSLVYGEPVVASGPSFRQVTTETLKDGSAGMRVWFDHASGLTSRDRPVGGFELAGADRHFLPANARIEGEQVVVSTTALTQPRYVRYGWSSVVQDVLYNAAGLPTSTFSSEEDPLH